MIITAQIPQTKDSIMKIILDKQVLCSLIIATLIPSYVHAAPDMYLNENLGFNVKGYNYKQNEFPCKVDKLIVKQTLKRAKKKDWKIEATGTSDKIYGSGLPVLAMDINGLILGSEEHTYGAKSSTNLPSVRVTAAIIDKKYPDGLITEDLMCAIGELQDLAPPTSSVMDLGVPSKTVCDVIEVCVKDLGKDIVDWVEETHFSP